MELLRHRKQSAIRSLFGFAAIATLATLYFFPPAEYAFYPGCLFRSLTGIGCPGCGSTRAVHELLHGNLHAAFQLNPGVVFALPLLGILGWRRIVQKRREN